MKSKFQLVALIGKYQTFFSNATVASSREALSAVADFCTAKAATLYLSKTPPVTWV